MDLSLSRSHLYYVIRRILSEPKNEINKLTIQVKGKQGISTPFSNNGFKGARYILASPKSAILTTPCSSPSPIT